MTTNEIKTHIQIRKERMEKLKNSKYKTDVYEKYQLEVDIKVLEAELKKRQEQNG